MSSSLASPSASSPRARFSDRSRMVSSSSLDRLSSSASRWAVESTIFDAAADPGAVDWDAGSSALDTVCEYVIFYRNAVGREMTRSVTLEASSRRWTPLEASDDMEGCRRGSVVGKGAGPRVELVRGTPASARSASAPTRKPARCDGSMSDWQPSRSCMRRGQSESAGSQVEC